MQIKVGTVLLLLKPNAPAMADKFNTYSFAEYQEKLIDLLKRVTTVSVGTMDVVDVMQTAKR